jgi:quercetin dioxygenase-like cupin family protein
MQSRIGFCTLLSALLTMTSSAREASSPPGLCCSDSLPDPLVAGWRGAPVCERLHEEATLRVLRCTFPPGAGHEPHFHPPHFGYALSGGRMRLTDARGTREVEIETGSSFASDGVAWHEVLNVGETTVSYLIVEPRVVDETESTAPGR